MVVWTQMFWPILTMVSDFFDVTVDELKAYEEQLKRIFQKMLANDLAFELNAKSMYLYHHEDLYRYALGLVKDLGCCKYSIGSDGHN